MRLPSLYVFSGAGLSAESGLATFRGNGGLWQQSDMSQVLTYSDWKAQRPRVFEFFGALLAQVAQARPNPAHRQLAAWQARWGPERVRLFTQNVDDLLERAGASAVTHLHGDLATLLCTACATQWAPGAGYGETARCPKCNSLRGVKPGVVFFGEPAPRYREMDRALEGLTAGDILLVVGTSFEVLPVERLVPLPCKGAERAVLVDLAPKQADWFGTVHAGPAGQTLPELDEPLTRWMVHAFEGPAWPLRRRPRRLRA